MVQLETHPSTLFLKSDSVYSSGSTHSQEPHTEIALPRQLAGMLASPNLRLL